MTRRRFIATAASAPLLAAAPSGKLRAGAATANITPPLGSSIAGYMTDRRATEVHDELYVRALALENGHARIAVAIVDSCAVQRTVIDRAKQLIAAQAGIPAERMLVAATHTHTAPPAAHLFQSPADPLYTDWLAVRIADAVRLASARLQPARIGWGSGREDRLVFNRRYYMKPGSVPANPFGGIDRVLMNPPAASPDIVSAAGPTDPTVSILAVEALDGRPLAVLGNYALHYVGGTPNGHISADYFGSWAAAMTRLAGGSRASEFPGFVAMLSNGCAGNINGIDFFRKAAPQPPYRDMERYAEILAAECLRTVRLLEFRDEAVLAGSIEEVECGTRLPSAEDIAAARQKLDAAPAPPPEGYRDRTLIYARETVLMAKEIPAAIRTPVQALRIGELGITTLPGEAFVELGLEIRQKSPFRSGFTIELGNDYRGYLPIPEAFELGGYETWRAKSSYLARDAAPKLVQAALRQLEAGVGG